jgi:hypothetical protein
MNHDALSEEDRKARAIGAAMRQARGETLDKGRLDAIATGARMNISEAIHSVDI